MVLVLLTSWLDLPAPQQDIQILELCAGKARLCRLAKSMGLGVAAHDIEYDDIKSTRSQPKRSAMDINESAGYLLLALC